MEDRKDSRLIDDLLDASLARYRGVEPRPGLENRILTQLRTEPRASGWLTWAWAWRIGVGLVAAGAVVVFVSLAYRQRVHAPVSVAESPRRAPALAPSRAPAKVQAGQRLTPRHHEPSRPEHVAELQTGSADLVSKSAAVLRFRTPRTGQLPDNSALLPGPRRDVFPSPAPLSEEERLLVSYVRQSPDGALAAFPEEGQPVASLRVPDLTIPRLEMNELAGITTDQTR